MTDIKWNHSYDAKTPVKEPIEIRLAQRLVGGGVGRTYQLTGSVTLSGLISYSLYGPARGLPESLSNLQSKVPFPGKAVPGWQAEAIDAAAAGLYDITEVR